MAGHSDFEDRSLRADADRLAHRRCDHHRVWDDTETLHDQFAGLARIGIDEISYKRGHKYLTVVGEPGTHGPLHCAAVGKVLIAFSPDRVRGHLTETLALDKFTVNTITDRGAFRAEIEAVRNRGYAVVIEEHEVRIRAIRVPIFVNESLVASVAIAAPAFRTSVDQLIEYVAAL